MQYKPSITESINLKSEPVNQTQKMQKQTINLLPKTHVKTSRDTQDFKGIHTNTNIVSGQNVVHLFSSIILQEDQ